MHDTGAAAALLAVAAAAVAVAASSAYRQPRLAAAAPGRDRDHRDGPTRADAVDSDAAQEDQRNEEEVIAEDAVFVGLVRLRVAADDRHRVKNDVILAMAIKDVVETLYVVIDTIDAHAAAQYTCELLETTWHLAAVANKPQLQFKIIATATTPHAWTDTFALPDLGAVYGENDAAVNEHQPKSLPRAGLVPVEYRSPALELRKYLRPSISYFDDQLDITQDGSARHAVVLVQGTFDHLHNGHKRLLSLAVGVCTERLLVGITAAPHLLAAMPFAELLEPLERRKQRLAAFVASVNASVAVEFIDVHDPWGPAGSRNDTGTLYVVSSSDVDRWDETRAHRFSLGLGALFVRIVRRTYRSTLSSRHIRKMLVGKRP